MAIYHNRVKIIGRPVKDAVGKPLPGQQNSVVSKAAYRAGQKLKDDRAGMTWDYGNRKASVVHAEILAPSNAPGWLQGEKHGGADEAGREARERLWNTIERAEKRKDSQLAREFELALPRELSDEQNIELVRAWCREQIVSKGFVVDFAVHRSEENPHCHVLCTMRPAEASAPEGFGKKPDMSGKFNGRGKVGIGAKADLEDWRETWAVAQNAALDAAGFEARVDHRTLEAQGIDKEPGIHIGVSATAMQRKGRETERGELSMWGKMDNLIRSAWRGIERNGEAPQVGIGDTWWERAQVAVGLAMEQVGDLLVDESSGGRRALSSSAPAPAPASEPSPSTYWQDLISQQRQQKERDSSEPGFG